MDLRAYNPKPLSRSRPNANVKKQIFLLRVKFYLTTVFGFLEFKPSDNKLNAAKLMRSAPFKVEKIMGKGKNASYLHFLILP